MPVFLVHLSCRLPPTPDLEMLYLIGLGLGDAKDITVKGLEVVRRCSRVYLEAYTSVLTVGKEALVGASPRGTAPSRTGFARLLVKTNAFKDFCGSLRVWGERDCTSVK